jgi:hypothetical protein
LRELRYPIYGLMIGLVLVVLAIATATRGAKSWIPLPGFNFQPSELGKVLLVLALSAFVVDRMRSMGRQTTARIMLLGLPALFVYILSSSVLRGLGDTVTPMRTLVVACAISAVLTPALIQGWLGLPRLGAASAAWASVASSLAKKQLHDGEQRYAKSLERELEIGREIQLGFLPDTLPTPEGWELRAHFGPARQVAGDFYDAFSLPNGSVALVLADVCGKGVGAALFMALFRSLLRALAETEFPAAASIREGLCATVQGTNDYIARTHGRADTPGSFLQLANHDPHFAWLRPLSELVVQFDELLVWV